MLLSPEILMFFTSTWIPLTISQNLLQWTLQGLLPHQEVHAISDRNFDDLTGRSNATETFTFSAFINQDKVNGDNEINLMKMSLKQSIQRIFTSTANVAIIVDLSLEKYIYETIGYVMNDWPLTSDLTVKTFKKSIWVVVTWPTSIKNEQQIESMRDSPDFIEAVQNFRVNSHLVFVFNLSGAAGESSPEREEKMLVYEAYLAGNHTLFQLLQNGSLHLSCNYCEGIAVRRFNFHERTLKVTAVNDSEVNDDIHVYEDANGTITYSKDGFSGSMHTILQQLLNFTTEPMLSRGFGALNPVTNRWEGSIGDVTEGRADLAISITIFQPNRAEVISFLPPADEHQINAFFIPSDERPIRDIFAQPFKPLLWAAVITTWIVLATCMIIFSLIRKRYGMDTYNSSNDESSEEESGGHDFTNDSFIWALGTACQQGWDEHPKAGSLRTIFISGSFTGVVAYAGYSAAIVSTLSLRIDPIQNPLQLLHSNLRVGIRKGFISSLLEQKNAKDTMSHFYDKVALSPKQEQYLNVSAGLDQVLNRPYAFITTRDTFYDLLKMTTDEKVICGIKDLPVLKIGFPIGYAVPKFSPFREVLRYALTMIREPGVLYRLRQRYSFKRRCLDDSENSSGYALGPNDVFTAFMILVAGIALSITFMLVERILTFQRFTYVR